MFCCKVGMLKSPAREDPRSELVHKSGGGLPMGLIIEKGRFESKLITVIYLFIFCYLLLLLFCCCFFFVLFFSLLLRSI